MNCVKQGLQKIRFALAHPELPFLHTIVPQCCTGNLILAVTVAHRFFYGVTAP